MEFIIPKQQYTGKLSDTGNSMRLPSVFNKINKLSKRDDKYSLKQGTINLDYGAGKYDNITTELAKQGITNVSYDPYNRSEQHNRNVINFLSQCPADTVTCSNVLNIIENKEIRESIYYNIFNSLKDGGVAYFHVNEGDRSGVPVVLKDYNLFQSNRRLSFYYCEICDLNIFKTIEKKGGLIIAFK